MIVNDGKQRARSEDQRTSVVATSLNYQGSVGTNTLAKAGGSYRSMQDVVTPGFRKRQQRGEILINSMSSIHAEMSGGYTRQGEFITNPGSIPEQWVRCTGDWSRFCTGWGLNSAIPDWWVSARHSLVDPTERTRAIQEACTRARSQIGRSNTDMWENLAEAHKSLELLKSPIASWFKFEKKARAVTSALSAAQAWLIYRYGVKPVVASVNDVLENLKKKARSSRATTRATSTVARSNYVDTFTTSVAYWSDFFMTVERQRSETIEVRAMSIDEAISDFEYTYGLASKQILTLPWELVPWSFVVDWFANVGDFIGALAQSFYPSSLGQSYTVQHTYHEVRTCVNTAPWNTATRSVKTAFGGNTVNTAVWKDRTPGLVGPSVVIKANFRLDNATRIADSLALAGQQVTRAMLGRK